MAVARSAGLTLACCAGLILPAAVCSAESTFTREVDAFVTAEISRQHVPGVAVGVIRGGQVLIAKGYGLANVEHDVPVTAETVFQSGSVGKQFTAVAVMMQVEDGKLTLEDPLTRYLTDAPESWKAITVRNLLTHTSGIPEYTDTANEDGAAALDLRRDRTEDELVHAAYPRPLGFTPGSRWHYSNTGYLILGAVIRHVSGRYYGEVLKERVFAPLGMKTARIISEEDIVPHRAAGYRLVNGELKNQEWVAPSLNTTADGSLYLALNDMIAWDRGLRAGALLRPESWRQIYTPVRLASGSAYPYGFGWDVDDWRGKPWYHHGGSWQGFRTYISRYLAADLTIIVLANLAEANPDRIVDGIAVLIDRAAPLIEPRTALEDSSPELTRRIRLLLEAAERGEIKSADLASLGAAQGEAKQDLAEAVGGAGKLKSLTLVDRRRAGDDVASSYLAAYSGETYRIMATVDPQGRLVDLAIWAD